MTQRSMWTCAAATTSTPLLPWPLGLPGSGLSIDRLRRWTMADALLMMMALLPPTAVLLIAPANVLQGAVRLHGFTSSPTPDTHVRFACACAAPAVIIMTA